MKAVKLKAKSTFLNIKSLRLYNRICEYNF